MISIINSRYIYEYVNTKFCRALNSGKKSIIGKSLEEIWGNETFSGTIKGKINRCLSGKSVHYKAAFMTPGWGYGIFQVTLLPVKSVPGKVTHIYAETINITGSESLKRELYKLKKELISIKSDYANFFSQKERMADTDLITDGVVHDFNNLIAVISGYAQLLNEELPCDSPMAGKIRKIILAAERARGLTEKMLGTGNQKGDIKDRVNINALLGEAVDMVSNLTSRNISFKINIPDEHYMVEADPGQLLRVFHNLLTNAVRSMKVKGGILSVSSDIAGEDKLRGIAEMEQESGKVIHIKISDTGYGIDRSQISNIFDPYYSRYEKVKGTGLGLYIVKRIIDEISGQIYVSTKKNIGTSFDIYLPGSRINKDPDEKSGQGFK